MRHHPHHNVEVLLFSATLFLSASASAAPINFQPIALTGEHAPGTAAGTTFQTLSQPALNAAGQVSYRATLAGTPFETNSGIWINDTLLARSGDIAPGNGPEVRFGALTGTAPAVINDAGIVAFHGSPRITGVDLAANDRAIWTGTPGNLQLVAIAGMPAPGLGPDANFRINLSGGGGVSPNQSPFPPLLSDSGRISFWADVVENGLRYDTLYGGTPAALDFIARSRHQADALPVGTDYAFFGTHALVDGAGNIQFTAVLEGPGTTLDDNGAIYLATATGMHLLRRDNDPVPGIPGARWSNASGINTLNESGQTLFESDLRGVAPGTEGSLWFGNPRTPALIARAGQVVPGEPDYRFGGSFDRLYLDDSGRTAFFSRADPADNSTTGRIGLWTGTPGAFDLVLAEGAPAPGAPDGVLINQLGLAAVNANGLLLFTSTLAGAGVTATSNQALFAGMPDALQLLIREGDLFEVAPGDLRQISGFNFPGQRPYLEYQLNDSNQVLASLQFTDGSHALYLVTLPEPTTLSLLVTPLLLLPRRRRR